MELISKYYHGPYSMVLLTITDISMEYESMQCNLDITEQSHTCMGESQTRGMNIHNWPSLRINYYCDYKNRGNLHEDHFHYWILHISKTKLEAMSAHTGQLCFIILAFCEHYSLPLALVSQSKQTSNDCKLTAGRQVLVHISFSSATHVQGALQLSLLLH